MADYLGHVEYIKSWMTFSALPSNAEIRNWLTFALDKPLTAEHIQQHFDRTTVNSDYQQAFDAGPGRIPVAFWQVENDNLHSLAKMLTYRHQPRLKNYRDDAENKEVRTYSSLSLSAAKLEILKKAGA